MTLGVATRSAPDNLHQPLGDATLNEGDPQIVRSPFERALSLSRGVWDTFRGFLGLRNAEHSARNKALAVIKDLADSRRQPEDREELEVKVIKILRDVSTKAEEKKFEYDRTIRPIVENIQKAAPGKVWSTEEHSRGDPDKKGLYLASLPPKELQTQITSFGDLLDRLNDIWEQHSEIPGKSFEAKESSEQIFLTRQLSDGRVEDLEFCFFEGHKMNVFKDGEYIGNLYYGSVLTAAQRFLEGKSVSLKKVEHKKMVVVPL